MTFDYSITAFSLLEPSTQEKVVCEVLHLYHSNQYNLEQVVDIFKNINVCEILKDSLLLPTARKIFETFKEAIDTNALDPLDVPLQYSTKEGKTVNAAEILLLVASKFDLFESNIFDVNQSLKILSSHFETTASFTFQAKAEQSQQPQSFTDQVVASRITPGKILSAAA
jgi:hypothetical protein